MHNRMKLTLVTACAAMILPAYAAPVTMPAGASHELRFDWNADVENHWLILAPRVPALIQGTERVARTGLANAQRRQTDVRSALMLGDSAAEGGVWARVGGAFGQQDDMKLTLGALSRPVSGAGVGGNTFADSEDLADYAADRIQTRLETRYRNRYTGQDWFDALTPAERDVVVEDAANNAFNDMGYDEQISHFNIGADFIFGNNARGAWIVGGAIGYVRASQEFDDFKSLNQASKFDWDTVNLGAYVSYLRGGFYVDAALSNAWHSIDMKLPVLDMLPAGSMIGADGQSMSLSLDMGWRFDLGNAMYLEPQMAAAWVKSNLDDTRVQRADALTYNGQYNTLSYGDPESQRLGGGLELGQAWKLDTLTLTGRLAARYWAELDRDSTVELSTPAKRVNTTIPNDPGVDTRVSLPIIEAKEASGYTQVTLGTELRNADSSFSGGLALDYLTGSDFDSYGLTASLRYQW